MEKLRRHKGRWFALGVLAVAATTASVGLLSTPAEPGGAAAFERLSKVTRLDSSWPVAQTRVFAAELSTRVLAENEALVDVSLAGNWKLVRLPTAATGARGTPPLRLTAELAVTRLELKTSPESQAGVRRALAEPMVFELSEAGLITGIGFTSGEQPDAAYALTRGLLRALAAAVQVAQPRLADAKRWTSTERDAAGIYQAAYEQKGLRSVLKTKQSYEPCSTCGASGAQTHIIQSHIELGFAADAKSPLALSAVASREATRVEGGTPMPKMSSDTKLVLRLLSAEPLAESALAAIAARAQGVRLRSIDDRVLDKRAVLDEAKLAGTTFASVLGKIAELDAQGKRSSGPRARAFSQLVTHLRFDRAAVDEAVRRIRSGGPLKNTLIDALGNAASEPAQAALRELLSEKGAGDADRYNILLSLSLTSKPSDATTVLLAELQDDAKLGKQARYGLGIAAYHLSQDEPARAEVIVSNLESRLAQATDFGDIMEYLRALGNAATSSTLDSIERYLDHANGSVRAAAVNALRRVPGHRADHYVALALLEDESADVRFSAAKSIDYRSVSPLLITALKDSLSGESERRVRLQAARAAAKWASEAPVLREVLSRLAQEDPDKKIRQVAGAAG